MILQLPSQLVCKYCWDWTVCGEGVVLLSTRRALSDCVDVDAVLRLLPYQVRDNIYYSIQRFVLCPHTWDVISTA